MLYLALIGLVFLASIFKGVLAPLFVFTAYIVSIIAIINRG